MWVEMSIFQQKFILSHALCFCAVYAAEIGVDFDKEMHNITFYPEDPLRTKKCFTITTHEDDVYEWQERYGVHMSFNNSFVMRNSPAMLVIEDNDCKGERGEGEGGRERGRVWGGGRREGEGRRGKEGEGGERGKEGEMEGGRGKR